MPPRREGRPERPVKLTADEAWFWGQLIEPAEHLEACDSPLCHAATRAWALYCTVCTLASTAPIDKDIKAAVSTYGTLLDKLCGRLALDPLGRARHKPMRPETLDPLAQFLAESRSADTSTSHTEPADAPAERPGETMATQTATATRKVSAAKQASVRAQMAATPPPRGTARRPPQAAAAAPKKAAAKKAAAKNAAPKKAVPKKASRTA